MVVALVNEPCPLCVHKMVPFDDVASVIVAVPLKHIVWLPPAVAVGCGVTVTVGVLVNCLVQPVGVYVANTLNVVVPVNGPVGKLILDPVPVTALPTSVLSALFLNW